MHMKLGWICFTILSLLAIYPLLFLDTAKTNMKIPESEKGCLHITTLVWYDK